MHGLKRDDFYKTSEEKDNFKKNLEKGYKLLDLFVEYSSKLEKNNTFTSCLNRVCETDAKMFDLSSAIIEFMPEFTPSWSYRKIFIHKYKFNDNTLLKQSLMDERTITYKCLKKSPKSYSVWHHRLWTLTCLFNLRPDDMVNLLVEELKLCFKLFTFDGRNFHCWSYFNFIKQYMKSLKSDSDNLEKLAHEEVFKLINENFSNYSAWYHRTNFPYLNISLEDDLNLLKHSIYTDPEDQTIWTYYDWLLFKRDTLPAYLCYFNRTDEDRRFRFYFTSNVRLDTHSSFLCNKGELERPTIVFDFETFLFRLFGMAFLWTFVVDSDQDLQSVNKFELVLSFTKPEFYSNLLDNANFYNNKKMDCVNVTKKDSEYNELKFVYDLRDGLDVDFEGVKVYERGESDQWAENNRFKKPINVGGEFLSLATDVNFNVLEEQLAMIDELISVDSESKYLLLTKFKLSQYLGINEDLDNLFQKLSLLDPFRKNYYKDMLAHYKARSRIKSSMKETGLTNVDLSNLSLSRLDYKTFLPFFGVKHLNLSNNQITTSSLSKLSSFLLLLETLDLSYNNIERLDDALKALSNLTYLKSLNLSNNPLQLLDPPYKIDCKIKEIDLTNTTISEQFTTGSSHESIEERKILENYRFKLQYSHKDGMDHLVLLKMEN